MWKVDSDFTHLLQTSSLHLRYLLTAEGNYRGNEKLNFHRTNILCQYSDQEKTETFFCQNPLQPFWVFIN